MKKIKVLIIDDSALIRQILTEVFKTAPDIEVVGVAHDPIMAREKIKALNPDVLTLDVEMPRMDGITFLRNLMRLRPMPVVMVSTLTENGADVTLQALELGAVDYVTKPKQDIAHTFGDYADELLRKIRIAAAAKVDVIPGRASIMKDVEGRLSADVILGKKTPGHFRTTDRIIAIGASTGGTEAIKQLLIRMPADAPGVVITQHIPAAFSAPFAKRMDKASAMSVCEAADGQQIVTGHVYIAPGNRHLLVERDGARYICRLHDGPPVNRHKPSVDVLFRSVAQNAGSNAIAALLTGMGNDGAQGLLEIKQSGGQTIAQDEKSSVVWGMPGEAVKLGAADDVIALQKIPERILALAKEHQIA
jgi:two-component system chemotaxis response regulator CheB